MTIIEKYRYGPIEPSLGQDQINGVVSVNVACLDAQTAGRRDHPNRLPPSRGELKLNPVIGGAGTVGLGLDAGQVRAKVAIEVGDGKLRPRPNRSGRRSGEFRGIRRVTIG
jgi:hypothetical protein